MEGSVLRPPDPARTLRGRRRARRPRLYPIRRFAVAYVAAVAFVVGVMYATSLLDPGGGATLLMAPAAYFIAGAKLCRHVSRRVAYNPNHATVESVAQAKWRTLLTWPLAVPSFIWQLLLVKLL